MRSVICPDCGQEIELIDISKGGDIVECPLCAGLSLRLREEGPRLVATRVNKASCPVCERDVILEDDATPGDIVRCCDEDFTLTYAFGSFALE